MKKKSKRVICLEEYVSINGIDQFMFHLGTSYNNPVMLFLHGGPGVAESLLTEAFQEKWEEIYTVVHWDQRGAGKTLIKNPNELPAIEVMLQDLYEVVQYLKKKYNKQKIVLFGHSWGSILGTLFIRRYPQEISYYVGAAQVISMVENERVGYNKVKELIEQMDNKKDMKKLESIGTYPGDVIDFDSEFMKKSNKVRKLQSKYKVGMDLGFSIWLTMLKSPIFRLSDIIAFTKMTKANKLIFKFLSDFNLYNESSEYKTPIYYILGGCDWQAPYIIAQDYFKKINTSNKKIYIIPNAGHFLMLDQPARFFEVLSEINILEKNYGRF